MGLSFSHGNANWGYLSFDAFRFRLAKTIGITLSDMVGFSGKKVWPYEDVIELLLDHSDCDGSLSHVDCTGIAPRLRMLVASWADDDSDKINALKLAAGMDEAAAQKASLLFL